MCERSTGTVVPGSVLIVELSLLSQLSLLAPKRLKIVQAQIGKLGLLVSFFFTYMYAKYSRDVSQLSSVAQFWRILQRGTCDRRPFKRVCKGQVMTPHSALPKKRRWVLGECFAVGPESAANKFWDAVASVVHGSGLPEHRCVNLRVHAF
jgi:hypothetical protein